MMGMLRDLMQPIEIYDKIISRQRRFDLRECCTLFFTLVAAVNQVVVARMKLLEDLISHRSIVTSIAHFLDLLGRLYRSLLA